MTGKIEQLKIEELHGHRNITVNFIDNILILVGENGAGKTTILRILYCILSGEYTQIAQLSFKKITLIVDGKEYTLEYSGIKSDFEKKVKRISRRLLPFRLQRYKAILDQLEPHTTREDVNRICIEYGVPVSFIKAL